MSEENETDPKINKDILHVLKAQSEAMMKMNERIAILETTIKKHGITIKQFENVLLDDDAE